MPDAKWTWTICLRTPKGKAWPMSQRHNINDKTESELDAYLRDLATKEFQADPEDIGIIWNTAEAPYPSCWTSVINTTSFFQAHACKKSEHQK